MSALDELQAAVAKVGERVVPAVVGIGGHWHRGSGIVVAENRVLTTVSWVYIWFFRGTPVLVQILIWGNLGVLYPRIFLGLPFTGIVLRVVAVLHRGERDGRRDTRPRAQRGRLRGPLPGGGVNGELPGLRRAIAADRRLKAVR